MRWDGIHFGFAGFAAGRAFAGGWAAGEVALSTNQDALSLKKLRRARYTRLLSQPLQRW